MCLEVSQFMRDDLSVLRFFVDLTLDSAPAFNNAGIDRPTLNAVSGLIGLVR